MLNVQQISSTLRGMSDQQLAQYAAMHKADPYIFPLAFQESQDRKAVRAGKLAEMSGQKPPPVVDQDLQQMMPQMPTGIPMSAPNAPTGVPMQGPGSPAQSLPEDQGIGALPAKNLQGMKDGGITGYSGEDESLVQLSPYAMKQLMNDATMSNAGVNANADLEDAGRLVGGVNLNRMDRNGESRQMQNLMANYMNNVGDVGVTAGVNKPLERGMPSDFYQTNLIGSIPVGEGRLSAGVHGSHEDGKHHINAHSLSYNTPLYEGRLNANLTKPVNARPAFNVQYNMPFADGGSVQHFKDQGAVYKTISNEDISGITNAYKPFTAEELATERGKVLNPMNAEMEQAYKPYTEKLAQREQELAGRKEGNVGNALLAAGLRMMAGTSPYAFQNIGAGGLEGLQTYSAAQKADQAARDALDHSNMLLMQAQRAERSGNSRDATALLDAAQKQREAHVAHELTGLQLKNTSQFQAGQLANTELQRQIEASKAAEEKRYHQQLEELYYKPLGAAQTAKAGAALSPEDQKRLKVDADINAMSIVKNLAARLKDNMIPIGSPEYIDAQKELYKITDAKYKQNGLPEPSYEDFVSQEIAPKKKEPGFWKQHAPEFMGGLPSTPPPATPGGAGWSIKPIGQ